MSLAWLHGVNRLLVLLESVLLLHIEHDIGDRACPLPACFLLVCVNDSPPLHRFQALAFLHVAEFALA